MKVFGFILRLAVIIALVLWLVERPGTAQIVWHDTVIESSAAVLILAVLVFAYLVLCIHRLLRFLIEGPRLWKLKRKINRLDEGQDALNKGLAAVARGMASDAGREGVRARKLLGQTPLTQFLMAQAAALAGDHKAALSIYQAMTHDDPTSAVLGYRGLITMALRQGRVDEVVRLCAQLEHTKIKVPWLHLVHLDVATRRKDWDSARAALEKARRDKLIASPAAAQQDAVLLTASAAAALHDMRFDMALSYAEQACKQRPHWLAAVLILAQAQMSKGHRRAALRLIEKNWSQAAHPQLFKLYAKALDTSNALELYKKIEHLTKNNVGNPYALTALAESALAADLWGESRKHLMALVKQGEATRSTYQLLANLERRSRGDEKAAAQWIAQGALARSDPTWLCTVCGAAHDEWYASCPSCGAFDSIIWSTPGQRQDERRLAAPSPAMLMLESIS
ncbi:MAG: hypothetical protein FWF24_01785 [Alphaproteobacteria bacterium]|nr:hypothetical protein [Alphaproteobacteria bacterium]